MEEEADRTHWEAARLIPDRSETEPEGTNDGGLERAISVPPKHNTTVITTVRVRIVVAHLLSDHLLSLLVKI